MYSDDIHSDAALVTRLIAAQAPQWQRLEVMPLLSSGTDNALYRLGEDLLVRLPRRPAAVPLLEKELALLPRLDGLSLQTPHLRLSGRPSDRFPYPFAVFDWIEGALATPDNLTNPEAAVLELARFVRNLHQRPAIGVPLAGAANHHRGGPLRRMDTITRDSIDALADEINAEAARDMWGDALAPPRHDGPPKWLHGDLKADNLLALYGRMTAVLDWGLTAAGDPAADYACAWVWVPEGLEATFFDAVGACAAARTRARGWALYGAVIALSYYRSGRNAALCRTCRATLSRLGVR